MTYEEKLAKARKLRDLLWGKTQPDSSKDDKSDSKDDKTEGDDNESK